jgi:hypothetical protein
VPFAGPGCEKQQEPRAAAARDRASFVGIEVKKRAGVGLDRLAAALDANRPSRTRRSADSFTPWSPSASPGRSPMRTARSAPSLECKTTGDRVPCGISTSGSLQWRMDWPFPHPPSS